MAAAARRDYLGGDRAAAARPGPPRMPCPCTGGRCTGGESNGAPWRRRAAALPRTRRRILRFRCKGRGGVDTAGPGQAGRGTGPPAPAPPAPTASRPCLPAVSSVWALSVACLHGRSGHSPAVQRTASPFSRTASPLAPPALASPARDCQTHPHVHKGLALPARLPLGRLFPRPCPCTAVGRPLLSISSRSIRRRMPSMIDAGPPTDDQKAPHRQHLPPPYGPAYAPIRAGTECLIETAAPPRPAPPRPAPSPHAAHAWDVCHAVAVRLGRGCRWGLNGHRHRGAGAAKQYCAHAGTPARWHPPPCAVSCPAHPSRARCPSRRTCSATWQTALSGGGGRRP